MVKNELLLADSLSHEVFDSIIHVARIVKSYNFLGKVTEKSCRVKSTERSSSVVKTAAFFIRNNIFMFLGVKR